MADIITLHPRPDAPLATLPRQEFGRLPPGYWLTGAGAKGMEAAREDDLRQQRMHNEIARAARAAAIAAKGSDAMLARALSEALDLLHEAALTRKGPRFHLLAQDIASLSERCSLIEAEAQK